MSVAWLARGGWRQAWAWTPPAALFPLLAFLLLFFLFVYSVATFRWGFPVHRFVLTWMAPAFPLLCVPLLYGGRRLVWACLGVVLIVSIAGFALVDRQRPDVYESHGVLAWKEVEAEVRADRREPNAQIIIPEGQAEYAAASATVFAPSVSYDIIPVQDGAFLPAIKRSDAAFVVIHRRNFPGMEQLLSHDVFYQDGHYVVLVPRGAGP